MHTFEGHTGSVSEIAFSPDGQQILSGSEDSTVRLWRNYTWQDALTEGCNRLQFHPALVAPKNESAGEACLKYSGWEDIAKVEFLVRQAPFKVEEGGKLAIEGKIKEAISAYEEAQKLNPEIDLNPDTEAIKKKTKAVARALAARAKVQEGQRLAEEGKVQKAIAIFKQAQKLNPEIDLNPEKEVIEKDPKAVARKLAAEEKVKELEGLNASESP